MDYYQKPLAVGKTTRYSYTVDPNWLGAQSITAQTITVDALVTLGTVAVVDNVIFFYLTGVSVGTSIIDIEFSTVTQTDCAEARLLVQEC